MKHIQTINKKNLKDTAAKGGCGECQASCQSALSLIHILRGRRRAQQSKQIQLPRCGKQ